MIAKVLIAATTITSLAITFVTVFQLSLFLSSFTKLAENENSSTFSDVSRGDDVSAGAVMWSSIVDISLLIIFIVQHSFTMTPLKKFLSYINAQYLQRVLYNLFMAVILQVTMLSWQPIPKYVLWNINVEESPAIFKLIFFLLHMSCWLLFYVMAISFDITELFGLKPVYHNMMKPYRMRTRTISNSGNSSNDYVDTTGCSEQFSSLKESIQHPGLICLTVILWVYPVMRLDRLFLAVIWTVYMALALDVDDNDVNYVREQRQKKFIAT